VLDLYDTFRLTHPAQRTGNGKFQEIPTYDQADKLVGNALAGLGGRPVVLLNAYDSIAFYTPGYF
jgi:anaerobic selenocysteine-containing dehydrogenase